MEGQDSYRLAEPGRLEAISSDSGLVGEMLRRVENTPKISYSSGMSGYEDKTRCVDLYDRIRASVKQHIDAPFDSVTDTLSQKVYSAVEEYSAQQPVPTWNEAMKYFDTRFLNSGFEQHYGNISQIARYSSGDMEGGKSAEADRRAIYRAMQGYPELKDVLDGARPWKPAEKVTVTDYCPIDAGRVEYALRDGLAQYQTDLHPTKYGQIDQMIGERSQMIVDTIKDYVPTPEKKLDEFMQGTYEVLGFRNKRREFERQFLTYALEHFDGDIARTAEELQMDRRTLRNRLESLNVEEELRAKEADTEKAADETKPKSDFERAMEFQRAVTERARAQALDLEDRLRRKKPSKEKVKIVLKAA